MRVGAGAFFVTAITILPALGSSGSATVARGNVIYTDATGESHQITNSGHDSSAVLSPDGTKVAFLRQIRKSGSDLGQDLNAIMIFDIGLGTEFEIVPPHDGATPQDQFSSLSNPTFSLDGNYLYVLAEAWATSSAVHQIDLARHREKFVTDGNSDAVIRTGPWRGYLLVSRHRYWPQGGSYNPVYVVKPDGAVAFMIPETQSDDGINHAGIWLKKNGWSAS